jgi:hypothetical protein
MHGRWQELIAIVQDGPAPQRDEHATDSGLPDNVTPLERPHPGEDDTQTAATPIAADPFAS